MEKKSTNLIQTMLDQVKEEVDYQDEGEEIWLYALSLNRKDLEDLLQARSYAYKLTTEEVWVLGLALERAKLRKELEKLIREEGEEKELSARCLIKQKDSDLLDGTEVKFILKKNYQKIQLEVDEGYREHEIGYERIFGTNLEDGLIWLGKELNLIYLDLREDSYTSYKKS